MLISSVALCGPGRMRTVNQDNFYSNGIIREDALSMDICFARGQTKKQGLFAVADGMGGEEHGELASLCAVTKLMDNKGENEDFLSLIESCNLEVCELSKKLGGVRMGTTIVGLFVDNKNATVFNVGDSSAYLLRDGKLVKLSVDDNPVAQMVLRGILDEKSAARHPDRHKITQYLGIEPERLQITPHFMSGEVFNGDIFLLCSDGLTGMVNDERICSIVLQPIELQEKAEKLYASAMLAGGADNITILLVQIGKV